MELKDFTISEMQAEIDRRKRKAQEEFKEAIQDGYNNGLEYSEMERLLENY